MRDSMGDLIKTCILFALKNNVFLDMLVAIGQKLVLTHFYLPKWSKCINIGLK